jgi:hypothetical protein
MKGTECAGVSVCGECREIRTLHNGTSLGPPAVPGCNRIEMGEHWEAKPRGATTQGRNVCAPYHCLNLSVKRGSGDDLKRTQCRASSAPSPTAPYVCDGTSARSKLDGCTRHGP